MGTVSSSSVLNGWDTQRIIYMLKKDAFQLYLPSCVSFNALELSKTYSGFKNLRMKYHFAALMDLANVEDGRAEPLAVSAWNHHYW